MKRKSTLLVWLTVFILTYSALEASTRRKEKFPSLFPVQYKGKYGYIDRKGKKVIKPKFDYGAPFNEGRACVRFDNGETYKWSYIDTRGNLIVKPQFDWAHKFSEGFAVIVVKEKYGFVNRKGEVVIKPKFDYATRFSEGLAAARFGDKWGFINKKGNRLVKISSKIGGVNELHDGLAPVWVGEYDTRKYGFIDRTGKMIIKPQFDATWGFSKGLAVVRKSSTYSLINKKDEAIEIDSQIDYADNFSEGLARIRVGNFNVGKYGFMDKTGKIVIEPEYDDVGDFSEGLASIKLYGKWGYINKKGGIAIMRDFTSAEDFKGGLARVNIGGKVDEYGFVEGGKWGYINREGKYVWKPTQ